MWIPGVRVKFSRIGKIGNEVVHQPHVVPGIHSPKPHVAIDEDIRVRPHDTNGEGNNHRSNDHSDGGQSAAEYLAGIVVTHGKSNGVELIIGEALWARNELQATGIMSSRRNSLHCD